MTAVGFEPTPLRNGALSHRLRPLGQTVLTTPGLLNSGASYERTVHFAIRRNMKMTLAGLEPAIFGSEDQRLIH